jgi:DNA/RNA-binding domain of Phe-tRNA-synthetase-like protein
MEGKHRMARRIFEIAADVFARVPHARFAAVVAHGVENAQPNAAAEAFLSKAVQETVERFNSSDPKAHPAIAIWRETFRTLGWSPSTYLSSVEALVRRSVKGNPPPHINPAVDLANAISLRYLVPVGAHDLASAPQGIDVRLADPAFDRFFPLGSDEEEQPTPGEIVYAHEHDIRTRRWVWRQSRTGLVTPSSRDILFPLDGFVDVTETAIREAAHALADALTLFLDATVSIHWLTPEQRTVSE